MPLEEPLFSELLQRLDGESGMRRKVRLLAGSWSLLSKLSVEQRQQLALAIGNRWAWRNIESLFGNPAQLSDNQREVKTFFDDLRETEPDELLEIGKEIKRGEFAGAKGLVLEAVGEALDEEPQPSPATPVVMVPPSERESERRPPSQQPMKAPSLRPLAPSEPQSLLDEKASRPEPAPAPEPEPEPEPGLAPEDPSENLNVEPSPSVVPRSSKVEEVKPRDSGPAPDQESKPAREHKPEFASARKPVVVDTKPREPLRPDASGLSASELLRVLRRLSAGELSSSRPDRAAMVGSLTSGWAARRAVSAMIRSQSVADLEEALALIRQLPTATQQTWCLGDLIQLWDLDDVARRRVLAAAPTGSAKRRLARRGGPRAAPSSGGNDDNQH